MNETPTRMPGTPPAQTQEQQPGEQRAMHPQPESIRDTYRGSGRLDGKVAIVTGGDSGIGRAVALHFAREGASVAVAYLEEKEDARETERLVRAENADCLLFAGDLGDAQRCQALVDATMERFGKLDILVNNAAEQHPVDKPEDLDPGNVQRTFRTNVFAFVYLTTAALPHLPDGGSIINTSSVTAVRGNKQLPDYSATKGAILAFTMSLAQAVAERGIRVNAVAPGPIWTPLIPSTFDAKEVAEFGASTLFKRPGQPSEVAPAYVFLASQEASYITGQTIHINGGGHISA
ncbi:NAD(P)-dependent dehydrogenase (short-subunit alcohol dehydrogenase family) [Luteimonas cucumeris]|uniref:NAD(P)-dependent dehydrogenase (Short-subunit alcohol dehydrogenase family) n=1 Tax=Luteimonas cucumeris TaxID=985012 RepID=A0A562L274_9GAMM|nr:SDR family oxidoreductase [Luteimonas cucumeris]TWI01728.1 NAD(P)-dependent dehydrogenase (short-subunit alcohol dehydrogenase family) [Luteimonas cucumeris]